MAEYKREFRNIFINKSFQTRFTYYFVALSIALMGLMMLFMNTHINELRVLVANVSGLPMTSQLAIEDALSQLFTTAFAFLVLALVGAIAYGVVISHRIAGPMFAILSYIQSMKAGKFEERRSLRPYDELTPIMDSLHELADDLKKKRA
jgi:nitrate/nitrite-specific signal transduction histidine kinase